LENSTTREFHAKAKLPSSALSSASQHNVGYHEHSHRSSERCKVPAIDLDFVIRCRGFSNRIAPNRQVIVALHW